MVTATQSSGKAIRKYRGSRSRLMVQNRNTIASFRRLTVSQAVIVGQFEVRDRRRQIAVSCLPTPICFISVVLSQNRYSSAMTAIRRDGRSVEFADHS